jgi:hypothetical protein
VESSFDCSHNKLITLEGGPEYIGQDFYCEGCPKLSFSEIVKFIFKCDIVGEIFSDYDNNLLNKINESKKSKDYKEIIRIIFNGKYRFIE